MARFHVGASNLILPDVLNPAVECYARSTADVKFDPAVDFGAREKLTVTRFAQSELAGVAAMPSAVEILYSLTRS
jgi:hypothetical protein